jgi:hypothetical protein
VARLCKRWDDFGKRQDDFARQPLVAPIKTHLSPELAGDYVFHDAPAESAVRGRRDRRPARLDPAQTEPSVRRPGPDDFNMTTGSEPYFAALVANSCKEIATV